MELDITEAQCLSSESDHFACIPLHLLNESTHCIDIRYRCCHRLAVYYICRYYFVVFILKRAEVLLTTKLLVYQVLGAKLLLIRSHFGVRKCVRLLIVLRTQNEQVIERIKLYCKLF